MVTDDSMSDDVFEDELRAPALRSTPSPTGYRDYKPPADTLRANVDEDVPIHKTILLGDSGVGKTSLLVQFETGKFQAGNFSATVGIGFTVSTYYTFSLRATELYKAKQRTREKLCTLPVCT